MPRLTFAAMLLALAAAGCGGTRSTVTTVTVEKQAPAPSATGDQRLYGTITSLARHGDHYELRFDPVWFLSGVTANVAQAEDQGVSCAPASCPPVANDNYKVNESRRSYTYILPAGTHGTVLTRRGQAGGPFPATRIDAAGLARLVAGTSSVHLFEPLTSGMWLLVHIDTVRSFAQQYVP